MEKRNNLLIIFARNPNSREVKSRLAKKVGEAGARAIYEYLLRNTIQSLASRSTVRKTSYDVKLYVAGAENYFRELINKEKILQQRGEDLGQRMLNAFETGLKSYNNVILVGSDIPDISEDFIEAAFRGLENDEKLDGVIGPAEDGGYYLIGLKKKTNLFRNIEWGSSTVFEDTMSLAREMKLNLSTLEEKRDIDEVEDLYYFGHPARCQQS